MSYFWLQNKYAPGCKKKKKKTNMMTGWLWNKISSVTHESTNSDTNSKRFIKKQWPWAKEHLGNIRKSYGFDGCQKGNQSCRNKAHRKSQNSSPEKHIEWMNQQLLGRNNTIKGEILLTEKNMFSTRSEIVK